MIVAIFTQRDYYKLKQNIGVKMNLYKNQRGVINPLIIVLIVAVIGAVGFAGYKVYDNNKSKDSSSSSTSTSPISKEEQKTIDAECKKQYNDDDFCKFASNWDLEKTYKLVQTTTGSDGKTTTITIEADGDNTSSVITENGQENGAYITLNKVSYMKDYTDGSWFKMPQDANSDVSSNPAGELDFTGDEDSSMDRSTVKSLGKEKCENKNCFKYQVIDPEDTTTKESLLWFDDKDYKLVRMQVTDNDGTVSNSLFSYPDSVKISEPSPVKEFDASSFMAQ